MWINIFFFSSISLVRISYKTICLKTWSWYKTHWKMKSGRALIGIFQKRRIKNLRGSVRSDLKNLDSFTLETSKNHLIRNFLHNGRLRVNIKHILCAESVSVCCHKFKNLWQSFVNQTISLLNSAYRIAYRSTLSSLQTLTSLKVKIK